MTKLAKPEQWVLHRMNEMELAEMIEQHIDYYVEYENGIRRSVHLPMQFVRHYLQRRNDDVLPTVVAIAHGTASSWPTESCWHRTASIASAASSSLSRRSSVPSSRRRRTARRSACGWQWTFSATNGCATWPPTTPANAPSLPPRSP